MTNLICLDKNYSTTKLLTQEKPIIVRSQEDKFQSVLFLPETQRRQGEGGLRRKGYFKKSYDGKPLISIITVVFNGEKYLEQTIQSVIDQNYDNIEYIIIDGGSTDETLNIIKKYEDQIDYWVSEPDSGIYDAMNKGLILATGEYIAYINADDWYEPDTISLVAKAIKENKENKEIDYFFGNVDMFKSEKKVTTLIPRMNDYKIGMPFGHPSLFIKNTILKTFKFNTDYKIIADYDLAIRLIKAKYTYLYIPNMCVNYRLGGASQFSKKLSHEHFKLYKSHFGVSYAYKYLLLRTIKDIIKKILARWDIKLGR